MQRTKRTTRRRHTWANIERRITALETNLRRQGEEIAGLHADFAGLHADFTETGGRVERLRLALLAHIRDAEQ
jgi:hypothetical protein